MIVGLIADIHSNAAALRSVFERFGDVDEIWCLGDIVGYGPEPAECIDMIRARKHACIAGNHDLCVLQKMDVSNFTAEAIEACARNRNQLNEAHLAFLADLPLVNEPLPDIMLVHGSPKGDIWDYILSSWQAEEVLSETQSTITFIGHSHIPLVFTKAGESPVEIVSLADGQTLELDTAGAKYLINPGSVGQPRDGDPRASFMLFNPDDNTLEYHRIEYPVDETQEKMRLAGYPPSLSDRLTLGA